MQSIPGRCFLGVVACGFFLLAGCGGGSSGGSNNPAPKAPAANAGGPYSGMVGVSVSFSGGESTDPQGETLTYAWNFGEGSNGAGVSPTHTYAMPGTYTVSLMVTNTSSLTNTGTSKATIAAAPPVANAGGPYTGTTGAAVSFSGSGSTDPQGEALTYTWNFGDSTTGTGVGPTHTYASPGTYTVSLMVTNTSGLSNTATSKATIALAPLSDVALTGLVYGGQQAIVGAHVYLFAANTTGYGGAGIAASSSNASVSLISAAETGTSDSVGAYVATGSNGGFSLTGDYSCSSGQQLYLYVLGETNAAAGLMAAIGSCPASGSPAIAVTVNEVTTIAAAYALAGFATDATHVSSSGTALAQVGIANAFANAGNLASVSTGAALATTPSGNGLVPQAMINTLANMLAACVNSNSSCSTLLSAATSDGTRTGARPTDTATAAINIAHNPNGNYAAADSLGTANPVFLPTTPTVFEGFLNSFGIVVVYTGGGLGGGSGIAIDGAGDVWIPNPGFPIAQPAVIELSSSGSFLSGANGYSGGGLDGPIGVAIDDSGNAWITNEATNSVTKLSASGVSAAGSPYTGGGLSEPTGIAVDRSGNAWIANYSGNSVTELSSSGFPITGSPYVGAGLIVPMHIAIDGSGVAWVADYGNSTLGEISSSGTLLFGIAGANLDQPDGIAIDGHGNAWVTNLNSGVTEISNPGSYAYNVVGTPPNGLAIDGSGTVWIAASNLVSAISNSGTVLMELAGYNGSGSTIAANGIAVDGSGNVWLLCNHFLVEIVGMATPVITPIAAGLPATPTANGSSNLGTRP